MTHETHHQGNDDACAPSGPNPPKIHELYFAPSGLTGSAKAEAMEINREQLRQRIGDTFNPIDSLQYQMKGLDLAFHESMLEASWNHDNLLYKDAFKAQRLYQDSVRLMIKDRKK